MTVYQQIKYHEPLLQGNNDWSNYATQIFKNKNYMHHYANGVSTTIIPKTDHNGRSSSMPRDDLYDCQGKCEPR